MIKFSSIVFSYLYIHLYWYNFMVHIISYEIVSSLKPDSLFTSESLPNSKYYESLFHKYFNSKGKETIFHSSIVYLSTKTTTQVSTDGGKLTVNSSVYIWWSITHSLKCYYKIKYIEMLKNLSDIRATNLIHEKEGNLTENLHNNYAKMYIHEQESEGKMK